MGFTIKSSFFDGVNGVLSFWFVKSETLLLVSEMTLSLDLSLIKYGLVVCVGELRLLLHRMQLNMLRSVCMPILKVVCMPSKSMRCFDAHEHVSQCFGFFVLSSFSRYFATTTGDTLNSPFLL